MLQQLFDNTPPSSGITRANSSDSFFILSPTSTARLAPSRSNSCLTSHNLCYRGIPPGALEAGLPWARTRSDVKAGHAELAGWKLTAMCSAHENAPALRLLLCTSKRPLQPPPTSKESYFHLSPKFRVPALETEIVEGVATLDFATTYLFAVGAELQPSGPRLGLGLRKRLGS